MLRSLDAPGLKTLTLTAYHDSLFTAFPKLLPLIQAHEHLIPSDPEFWNAASLIAWALKDHDSTQRWAKRVIREAPKSASGYLRLALSLLSDDRPMDSFLVFSAGANNAEDRHILGSWWALAEQLAFFGNQITFNRNGIPYSFFLNTQDSQMTEAACHHNLGKFTEEAELECLGQILPRGGKIVEVGTLVGNHSVFLASTLKPESYTGYDLNPESVAMTQKNLRANQGNFPQTEWGIHLAALVTRAEEKKKFEDRRIPAKFIHEILEPGVSFAKIDVDGLEKDLAKPLCDLLKTVRCMIMLEVETSFIPTLQMHLAEAAYTVAKAFDHGAYQNLLLAPKP